MKRSSKFLLTSTPLLFVSAVFLTLVGLIFKDFFYSLFNIRTEFAFLLFFPILFLWSHKIRLIEIFIIFYCLVLIILSSFTYGLSYTPMYPISMIYAVFMRSIDTIILKNLLGIILVINILAQIFELSSGNLIFEFEKDGIIFDTLLYTMYGSDLRTRGFIASPLLAVSFSISYALISANKATGWLATGVIGILGQGRLGMLMGLFGYVRSTLLLRKEFNSKSTLLTSVIKKKLLIYTFISAGLFFAISYYSRTLNPKSLERIIGTFSFDSDGNISRLTYWLESINHVINSSVTNFIFGDPGYTNYHNIITESDLISILINYGIIGVFAFILPLIFFIRNNFFSVFVLLFVMLIYPHAQSFGTGAFAFYIYLRLILDGK